MSLIQRAPARAHRPQRRRRRVLMLRLGIVLTLLLVVAATTGLARAASHLAAATDPAPVLIYEAIPSVEVAAPALAAADGATCEALAATVLADVVPDVLAAVGTDAHAARSALTQGGWRGRSSVSLQTRVVADDAQADRIAAALGYVLRQYAVLVVDPHPAPARGVRLVRVGLDGARFDGRLAHAFFVHAGQVASGLSAGYTAVDGELWFINVRAADGRPDSGIADAPYSVALRLAAASFADAPARVVGTGRIEARLVADDWAAAPEARQYRARLGSLAPDAWAALDAARAEHSRIVRAAEAALTATEPATEGATEPTTSDGTDTDD